MTERTEAPGQWPVTFKGKVAHRLQEGVLRAGMALRRGGGPSLVAFPHRSARDVQSYLRTHAIARCLGSKHGWNVTIVPFKFELAQRRRILRIARPAAALMGISRHPLNRPRLYEGVPVVFDIDDSDYLWPDARDQVIECCRDSHTVIAGSRHIADWCREYNPNVEIVWTGTPAPKRRARIRPADRGPVVAWAAGSALDYPKEFAFILEVLQRLAARARFEFWLYGVRSEARAAELTAGLRGAGVAVRTFPFMKYEAFLKSLEHVAVGLQVIRPDNEFSQGKSFGKVLAYLVSEVAVVASNAADHALFFRHGENGMLAETADDWVCHIERLLSDPAVRGRVADAAYDDFLRELSTDAAAAKTHEILRRFL